MFISNLRLQNFKRFTELTLDLAAAHPPPRLVLLIGANGSGKSSIFDAFEWLSQAKRGADNEPRYYAKTAAQPVTAIVEFSNGQTIVRQNDDFTQSWDSTTAFYGRSALRQVPQLTRTNNTAQVDLSSDSDRPRRYIHLDQRFENDIDVLTRSILKQVFNGISFNSEELRAKYLTPINDALGRIFTPDAATSLTLVSFIPPLEGKPADIRFRKGQSEIHYDLLSSGEKEVVNILFNLLNRRELYQDTIYFIDELDAHLNTALQYALLKEITEYWIPAGCQFWTASHSLGFIQYAREAEQAATLDFDLLDFDQPQVVTPQPKESLEVYEIAVPKQTMFHVFQGKQIIVCENKNDEFYNLLGLPGKIFVGVQDKRQVYLNVKNNPAYFGLMDRDYLTDTEITKIQQRLPNLRVLTYYAFENYLYHPDNINEVAADFDATAYRAEITRQKNEQRDYILMGIEMARRSYAVLNDENIERDRKAAETIITALRSDEFDQFYAYFDMKTRFNRQSLSALKLSVSKLAQTNWFRSAISKLLQ